MHTDNELIETEKNIIKHFEHEGYTSAEVYLVCDVVKAQYMFRAYEEFKEITDERCT